MLQTSEPFVFWRSLTWNVIHELWSTASSAHRIKHAADGSRWGVSVASEHTERGKWDNNPQLIRCTLKTRYSRRRQQQKKSRPPAQDGREILGVRWRPRRKPPAFSHVWNFLYAQFSGFDSSLLRSWLLGACTDANTHTHTQLFMKATPFYIFKCIPSTMTGNCRLP